MHKKSRRSHTTPSALSPKSLSFSLRHTAVGVFLLDSLKKRTTDTVFNSARRIPGQDHAFGRVHLSAAALAYYWNQ